MEERGRAGSGLDVWARRGGGGGAFGSPLLLLDPLLLTPLGAGDEGGVAPESGDLDFIRLISAGGGREEAEREGGRGGEAFRD